MAGERCSSVILGGIRSGLGDFKGAIEYYLQGLKIAEEQGCNCDKRIALCGICSCYRRLGNFELAREYHRQHLDVAKEVGDRSGEGCASYSLGLEFELLDCLHEALDCYRSSVNVYNDMRCLLQEEDVWKVNFRDMHQDAYTALWRTLVRLSKTDEALCAAEQGRAQALMDLMESQYGLELRTSGCLDLSEMASTIESDRSKQIVFVALDGTKINLWVLCKGNDLQFRQVKIQNEDATIFLNGLRKKAFKESDIAVPRKCGDRPSHKLRNESPSNTVSGKLIAEPVGCENNSLRLLYDNTVGPITSVLQCDEIIIVPDGPLHLVPFAAFVDKHSRYLSESVRMRVIPSLSSLKLIADCPESYHAKSGALLVGDPCLEEITNIFGKPKLAQLPYAREEVRMIGEILNSASLTGKEATKDEVLKRISSVALVHIAAHGEAGSGEIVLAPNPTRKNQFPIKDDYILKISDVQAIQLRARLVVLSCCHSGEGEVKAEGVVGIARAFLGAGARSVLVSLWTIDGEATMEFMKSFYHNLSAGNSACVSLRQTMKCLRESDDFSAVKYWAPFVLIGDDVTLEFGEEQKEQ
ncbi:tetratricopeptide repeat protein 28-like [Oculina patagonica]